jgi:hypothetical protein
MWQGTIQIPGTGKLANSLLLAYNVLSITCLYSTFHRYLHFNNPVMAEDHNHRRNLGSARGEQMSPQYFFYLRIVSVLATELKRSK